MNIDHTNLLEVLKHEPKDPTDAQKCEAANELHEWLKTGGVPEK